MNDDIIFIDGVPYHRTTQSESSSKDQIKLSTLIEKIRFAIDEINELRELEVESYDDLRNKGLSMSMIEAEGIMRGLDEVCEILQPIKTYISDINE